LRNAGKPAAAAPCGPAGRNAGCAAAGARLAAAAGLQEGGEVGEELRLAALG